MSLHQAQHFIYSNQKLSMFRYHATLAELEGLRLSNTPPGTSLAGRQNNPARKYPAESCLLLPSTSNAGYCNLTISAQTILLNIFESLRRDLLRHIIHCAHLGGLR